MSAALAQPAEFEVASVRLNTANDRIVTVNLGPGGRFAARGYTLVLLMQRAYGVMDWNVTGGPGWIRSDRYDVAAKASITGNLTERQLQPMLQTLLADRFKLKLHKTSKEVAGYALVVGKDGPKVTASADGEEHSDTFRLNNAGLSVQGITMANFARYVGGKLGVIIADKTGLTGVYDFKVAWAEDPEQPMGSDGFRSTVLRAVQDQLGLKVTAQKITIDMLVIDSIQKVSEN